MKLTRKAIAEAAAALSRSNRDRELLWDDEISGFGIRLTRKGGAYFLNYRAAGGKERRLTLGTAAELTIEQARRKAAETKVAVRAGADPLEEKRAIAHTRATKGMTISQLSERWLADGASRWRPRTANDYRYTVSRHILPEIGEMVAREVTKAQIAGMVAKVRANSPATAAKVLRTASSMLRWAEDLELLEEAKLPRTKRTAPPVAARERLLSDDELATIWGASGNLAPAEAAFVRLVMLTVLRSGAAWQVDRDWLKGTTIHLPAAVMKGKRDHQVPIAAWAMPLVAPKLDAVTRHENRILQDLRKLTGISDFTFHDMRRSFRTWCSRNGVAKDHAEVALAHVSHQTALDKAYDKHTYTDEAMKVLLLWQEHIRVLAGVPA